MSTSRIKTATLATRENYEMSCILKDSTANIKILLSPVDYIVKWHYQRIGYNYRYTTSSHRIQKRTLGKPSAAYYQTKCCCLKIKDTFNYVLIRKNILQ